MTIAWRRLADVPRDDPRPWLYATARNLLLAEWHRRSQASEPRRHGRHTEPAPEVRALDPHVAAALRALSVADREALLLVAWEDLSPALAARAVGISGPAFRVRLHRARRRLRDALAADTSVSLHRLEGEHR